MLKWVQGKFFHTEWVTCIPYHFFNRFILSLGHLSEEEARAMFRHILDAVTYMHALDIVHRDIKCDNIFIDRNDDIKIGGK